MYSLYQGVLSRRGIALSRRQFEPAWNELSGGPASALRPVLGHTADFCRERDRQIFERLGYADADFELANAVRAELLSPGWNRPFPDSEPVLRELHRRGIQLHLVSNHTEDLVLKVANLGWSDWFGSITFSQEVGAEKPDPRVFRLALDRAACDASKAHYIGDSWEADYLGATRAGMHSVWLNRRESTAPGPCESITDLNGALYLPFR